MAAYEDAAREYIAAGIVPLPVGGEDGKRPLVSHPDKFGRRAALQIVSKFPNANLGFWCGRHNRLTVVDIDSSKDAELDYALASFGASPIIVKTASGKHHAYYRHGGERRSIRPIKGHPIDILGEGGLCVAPPSIRPAGGRYEFLRGGLADLPNLPIIRAGALLGLESATFETATSSAMACGVVEFGRRDSTLFRLALALANDAKTQADLLAELRKANAELCKPLQPDHEVQRAARSAWRYKVKDRLMVPGVDSSIILPSASITRLLAEGEIDAMALLALLRKAHSGQPGKAFAASPLAMERGRLIGSWDKRRYRNATRKLCELGELVQLTPGGRGKHDPAMYRFAPTRKGDGFAPQS
jgi:Bifunctional DNA primase/polymerase, N-terminal/Primase C terminal 1 (PriCT-1)